MYMYMYVQRHGVQQASTWHVDCRINFNTAPSELTVDVRETFVLQRASNMPSLHIASVVHTTAHLQLHR